MTRERNLRDALSRSGFCIHARFDFERRAIECKRGFHGPQLGLQLIAFTSVLFFDYSSAEQGALVFKSLDVLSDSSVHRDTTHFRDCIHTANASELSTANPLPQSLNFASRSKGWNLNHLEGCEGENRNTL